MKRIHNKRAKNTENQLLLTACLCRIRKHESFMTEGIKTDTVAKSSACLQSAQSQLAQTAHRRHAGK